MYLHIGGDISLDQRNIIGIFTVRSPELTALSEGKASPDKRRSVDVSDGCPRSMVLTADSVRYYSASTAAALARKMTRFQRGKRQECRYGEGFTGTEVAR